MPVACYPNLAFLPMPASVTKKLQHSCCVPEVNLYTGFNQKGHDGDTGTGRIEHEEQAASLRMWPRSGKTEQRMALRAKIILFAAEGPGLKEIEAKTRRNWQSCLKCHKRFLEQGLEGLLDQAGRGRPQLITPEKRVGVVTLASPGRMGWSKASTGSSGTNA